jgi:Mg2+ and Co2+ transporter CorA
MAGAALSPPSGSRAPSGDPGDALGARDARHDAARDALLDAPRDAAGTTEPAAGAAPSDIDTGAPPVTVTWIAPGACGPLAAPAGPLPELGYAWIDAHFESPRAWVAAVERLTGARPLDEHLADAENAAHPSYFDSTRDYEMIVFRGLAVRPADEADGADPIQVRTRPTVFFLFPRCLVSVRPADSRQVPALRRRLAEAARWRQRLPSRPEELMLRILNGMVDRYLELRQPLTDQLERAQRDLLDPRRPFRDWVSLLESRRQLRKLENLSEEQLDALQEWRDERLDRRGGVDDRAEAWEAAGESPRAEAGGPPPAAASALPPLSQMLEVRINDLVEHIERVRGHAHRLESSVESAVQLHFSATAHRTNQIMRTLTVITAIFMPLNLITGIFGMNFEFLPAIHTRSGFWWTVAAMAALAVGLVAFFRTRRYLEETGLRGRGGRRTRAAR